MATIGFISTNKLMTSPHAYEILREYNEILKRDGKVNRLKFYREIILKIRDGVRRGESISQVLTSFPKETPPLLTQMIMVGEKTGRLDSILINISDFYQKEIEVSISNLLSLIEPVLVVFLGLVVGFFVASILLPIYSGISGI